jgi:hypothetical protein
MASKKDILKDFGALLILLSITLFFSAPALFSLKTRYLGFGRDFSLFVWNVWWFRHALTVLHTTPFFTDYIFYPLGQLLYTQVLSVPHCLLFMCLCQFFSFTVSWNIHYLLSMALPALSMYILSRHMLRSRVAAVLTSIMFGFSPWVTLHTIGFIIEGSSVFALPLFFYALLRLDETGKRRWLFWSAFIWALACYMCLWTAAYIAVLFIVYMAFLMIKGKGHLLPVMKNACSIMLLFVLFSSPLICGAAYQMTVEGGGDVHWQKIDQFSIDPGSFFVPASNHTFFGHVANPFVSRENPIECTAFLGYSVLILFVLALFKRKERTELSVLVPLFFTFLVLSLGPSLHFFGFTGERLFGIHDLGGAKISIPLPYALFYHIPLLKQLRWPGRFIIGDIFVASILAGWFVHEQLLKKQPHTMGRLLIGGGLMLVLIFEFLPLPFPSTSASVPPEMKLIKDDPEDCTVLFIPLEFMSGPYKVGFHTGEDMLYQVYHQKRLVSGFAARVPFKKLYTLANLRIIKSILLNQHLDQSQVPSNVMDYEGEMRKLPELIRTDRAFLKGVVSLLKIKYVVVMQPTYLPHTSRYIDYLFGPFKCIDTGSMRIYKIDATKLPDAGHPPDPVFEKQEDPASR